MEKTIENILSILSDATYKGNLEGIDVNNDIKEQGIDSLDHMSFFFALEKAFNLRISVDDQNKLNSLNDILNYLKTRE